VVLAPIVAGAIILSPFWLINSASKQLKSAFKKLPASDTEEKGTPGEWRADYHLSRVRSWLASAKCGDANSQDKVGHSYQTGYGVSKDALEAYVWYRLAIINARWVDYLHSANRFLDKVKAQLIPEQVAEAERRIKAWKPEPAACEVQQQADGKTN
jgi:hypothetical protein|tara:strand:- start:129 stop:596 length:468 start_codon:yes stop_codon:yes gene_type:complete